MVHRPGPQLCVTVFYSDAVERVCEECAGVVANFDGVVTQCRFINQRTVCKKLSIANVDGVPTGWRQNEYARGGTSFLFL